MSAKRGKLHADIGVIGGSGLYGMEGLDGVREVRPSTPFGRPSDALVLGTVGGVQVAFLARHGRGHRLSPSEINYRANIYALKSVGVTRVISVSAVGSMKEGLKPGEIVLPDQFVDHTKRRASTFFDRGIVAHVAFSEPICQALAAALFRAARETGVVVHKGGVYFCIEGPQFSTRGESLLYRQWGVDVIGMTNMPEAKLAREAELCYATIALVSDYDCWHESEAPVTVEMILATLQQNAELATRIIRAALPEASEPRVCSCGNALQNALVTAPQNIPSAARKRLRLLLGHRLPPMKGAH